MTQVDIGKLFVNVKMHRRQKEVLLGGQILIIVCKAHTKILGPPPYWWCCCYRKQRNGTRCALWSILEAIQGSFCRNLDIIILFVMKRSTSSYFVMSLCFELGGGGSTAPHLWKWEQRKHKSTTSIIYIHLTRAAKPYRTLASVTNQQSAPTGDVVTTKFHHIIACKYAIALHICQATSIQRSQVILHEWNDGLLNVICIIITIDVSFVHQK